MFKIIKIMIKIQKRIIFVMKEYNQTKFIYNKIYKMNKNLNRNYNKMIMKMKIYKHQIIKIYKIIMIIMINIKKQNKTSILMIYKLFVIIS